MDMFNMFYLAGYSPEYALMMDQELDHVEKAFKDAEGLEVPYDLIDKDVASFLTFGGSATPVDQPMVVDAPTDLAQGPLGVVPIACHPAAPNWPHPVNTLITVGNYGTEDLVRLCTMIACPLCGEAHPADKLADHYTRHFALCIVNRSSDVCCGWDGCQTQLKYRSLKNHVDSQHLRLTNVHCPYCHQDSRWDNGKCTHTARDCSFRRAALGLEESNVKIPKKDKECKWCRRFVAPKRLPQFTFNDSYRAIITGPAQPPPVEFYEED
ncbi:uncharacterized protein TRAVEDRAFT_50678 [Trametes versicolor FP-101664 SS1]|uniref:uncharacterized protein n=1 Tax=Trametes versicolor (strain FP-101664) TaxID=717944 RepID=UPI00046217B1|nr:uncharacterized protein TRAVEDRAFT_50678 [Trametes versicolor FP-101664 SS1]EIW56196.1 hypothetical protein TRAVEDRAFT_50678 [Trametes versicolor FP-101664 SS1]